MPRATVEQVTVRPATAGDREFLLTLYASTRQVELDQVAWPEGQREAFLRMQFDLQDVAYHRSNPDCSFDVVEVAGVLAGRLYVDREAGEVHIIDIALLPRFQGRGIGAELVVALQREATATGATVSLHVGAGNRASRLYARLGFVVTDDLGVYRRMAWSP